ncbi:hypothetical protein AAE478_009421 [Parahypoxylon ruwenzoriense]
MDPDPLRNFLNDNPPATEPVLDHITDLGVRCDIFRGFQRVQQENMNIIEAELNAAVLAIVMVTTISRLKALLHSVPESKEWAAAGFNGLPTHGSCYWKRPSERVRNVNTLLPKFADSITDSANFMTPQASKLCKERDRNVCIVVGTIDPEAAHIFPFATSSEGNFGNINHMLLSFWGKEKYETWSKLIQDEKITESPKKLICLNHQLHFWWDHAKFALKPLRRSENEVIVQWHWQKDTLLKPGQRINWGERLAHRKSGMPVKTGQTFSIKADDPELLTSFELLAGFGPTTP